MHNISKGDNSHKYKKEAESNIVSPIKHNWGNRLSSNCFNNHKEQSSSIERGYREEIHDGEINGDEGGE